MNTARWTDLNGHQAKHALKLVPVALRMKWGRTWDVTYTIKPGPFGHDPNYYTLRDYLGYPTR